MTENITSYDELAKALVARAESKGMQPHLLAAALRRASGDTSTAEPQFGTPDGKRKLKFGAGSNGDTNYTKAVALSRDQSYAEWIRANSDKVDGLAGPLTVPEGVDLDEAWTAFGLGVLGRGWGQWNNTYAAKFSLGLGTGGEGGELVPTILAADVIDRLRAATPIFQAGAVTVPMPSKTYEIARLTNDPTATAWHAEAAAITPDTAMTLDKLVFVAKTLPVLVKASRELTEDADNVGEVVRNAMVGAIGVELTRAALRGDGTANSPTGIRNQSGVELFAFGTNGGPLTIDSLIDRVTTIRIANAEPNAMIFAPRTDGGLTKLSKDSNGNYFALPSPLAELGRFRTSVIPTTLDKGTSLDTSEVYIGDFTQLLVGMRTQLTIRTLQERYSDSGEIAFEAWMRADIQLAHGAAFSVVTDTTT